MDGTKLFAAALTGVCAALAIKQWKSELLPLLRVGMTLLFAVAALLTAEPLITYLRTLGDGTGALSHFGLLFKALALAILTQSCAEICRDCGESSIATGVETVGKVQILLLSLPLLQELLQLAEELLGQGAPT